MKNQTLEIDIKDQILQHNRIIWFYPTAFNDCVGIVFSHGVWMDGKILGRDIGLGGVGVQRHGVALT